MFGAESPRNICTATSCYLMKTGMENLEKFYHGMLNMCGSEIFYCGSLLLVYVVLFWLRLWERGDI